MKNFINSFIFIFLLSASDLNSNDSQEIKINFVPDNEVKSDNRNRTMLDYLEINFDNIKVFNILNNTLTETQKSDLRQPNQQNIGDEEQLFLNDNEYIKVKGTDNREKLFNGSIIVEFKTVPNFETFALENNLVFISDLSDINRGVFKIRNIYDVKNKISSLGTSSNILSIDLDLIDRSRTNK
jgi:hypothetical protein|tara:strand:+ start:170 stop:718 length:549 start_codon:yes stop_codon:yes gene_type:complete